MTKKALKRTIAGYKVCSIFLFVFQFIYHLFSHGVVSTGLKYVWLVPLIGGLIIILLNSILHTLSNRFALNIFNTGLACLINVIILQGILDIAGSDSPYLIYFYIIAPILFVLSLFIFVGNRLFEKV